MNIVKKSIVLSIMFGLQLLSSDSHFRSRSDSYGSTDTVEYNKDDRFKHVPLFEDSITPLSSPCAIRYISLPTRSVPVIQPSISSGCCAFIHEITINTIESFHEDIKNPYRSCVNCIQCRSERSEKIQICRKNMCILAGQCLCCLGCTLSTL